MVIEEKLSLLKADSEIELEKENFEEDLDKIRKPLGETKRCEKVALFDVVWAATCIMNDFIAGNFHKNTINNFLNFLYIELLGIFIIFIIYLIIKYR